MSQTIQTRQVLTLSEAARFLRIRQPVLQRLVDEGRIPARKIDNEWRFFRGALEAWLSGAKDYRGALLEQAGAFADDETLPELLKSIYAARGRPEVGIA
jgi:excisionase family DNA binding protein